MRSWTGNGVIRCVLSSARNAWPGRGKKRRRQAGEAGVTARGKQPRKEKQNMNCEHCKRVCPTERFQKLWKFLHRFVCPVGASEAKPPARRFASVSGSASAASHRGYDPEKMPPAPPAPSCEGLKAEMNRELLPRAVQLPVSEPDCGGRRCMFCEQPLFAVPTKTGWVAYRGKIGICWDCIESLNRVMMTHKEAEKQSGDTPQRVSSGGS